MAISTTVLTVQVSGRPGFESFAACLLSPSVFLSLFTVAIK